MIVWAERGRADEVQPRSNRAVAAQIANLGIDPSVTGHHLSSEHYRVIVAEN
jgi:hypothetical protein